MFATPGLPAEASLLQDIKTLRYVNPEPAVQRLLNRGPSALPAVIQALDNPDLREGARRVVWRSPASGRPYLIKGLVHPNSYVREVLFNSMQQRLPLRRTEIRQLQRLLKHKQARTVQMACLLLGENGPGSRPIYPDLKRLLTRREVYLQSCARQTLFKIHASRARLDLRRQLNHPEYETRSAVFAEIWQRFAPGTAELQAVLRRPNPAALHSLALKKWPLSGTQQELLEQASAPAGPPLLVEAHRLELAVLLDQYNPQKNRALQIWFSRLNGLADLRLVDARFLQLLQNDAAKVCRLKQDYHSVHANWLAISNAWQQLDQLCREGRSERESEIIKKSNYSR